MEFNIGDILARLKVPGLAESHTRHVVAQILSGEIGVTIEPKKITLKDTKLYLQVPGILKSAILLKQEEIKKLLERENITVSQII